MTTEQVSLRFAGDGGRVSVEELTGFDEQSVRDVSTATAIALLDRLVTSRRDRSWTAIALTASDRDRLLAAVYRSTFGPRVEGSPRCVRCDSPFDLSFALDDLLATVDRAPASSVVETLP